MPRLILLAGVLAGLVVAMPSAAAPVGSGKIAFATEVGSIYTINADGSGLYGLRIGGLNNRLWSPRWSPDGTQLAYTELSGGPTQILRVMNQDESGAHVVATAEGISLSPQPWSPDGLRIAWGPLGRARRRVHRRAPRAGTCDDSRPTACRSSRPCGRRPGRAWPMPLASATHNTGSCSSWERTVRGRHRSRVADKAS